MTVAPMSLSMRLPAVVNRSTHRAGDRLLNPLAAYLTAPQMTVAAHSAPPGSVSNWAENIDSEQFEQTGYETLDLR